MKMYTGLIFPGNHGNNHMDVLSCPSPGKYMSQQAVCDPPAAVTVIHIHGELHSVMVGFQAPVSGKARISDGSPVLLRDKQRMISHIVLPEPLCPVLQRSGMHIKRRGRMFHLVIIYFHQIRNIPLLRFSDIQKNPCSCPTPAVTGSSLQIAAARQFYSSTQPCTDSFAT